MSYILDALRRADAERERDPARGIHAQPLAPEAARRRPIASVWLGAGAVTAAILAAAYAWWPQTPQQVVVAKVVAQPAPVAMPAVIVPAATVIAPPAAEAPVAPPAPATARPNVPRPATRPMQSAAALKTPPPVASAPAVEPAPATNALATANAAPARAAVANAAPAVPAVASVQATPAPAGRIYKVSQLPADVQRELPKLAISGGVSSDNPAQRMLIVGGRVMFEGNELAPGLVLEQIEPHTAVLRFRGYRYSVAY